MTCEESNNTASTSIGDNLVQTFTCTHLDESTCRRWLLSILRPDPECPACHRKFSPEENARMLDNIDIRCGCGRKSSPRSGTILEGVRADYRSIMLLAIMQHWGVNKQEIALRCGMSVDTVRRLVDRISRP